MNIIDPRARSLSMSTFALLLSSAASLAVGACASLMPQRAEDLPYRTGTVERAEGGTVQRAQLAEEHTISGVACVGWVYLHPDGRLESADLASDATIAGHALPKGSRVFFRPDGSLEHCWLSRDAVIDGVPCAGGFGKIDTAFHANGRLKAAYLRHDRIIQGVRCKASLFQPLRFDEAGSLAQCERE
jgi:hypothetical protein